MKLKRIILSTVVIFSLMFNVCIVYAEDTSVYCTGIDNAQQIINNIDFKDILSMPKDYWAKDAIYKMAGLTIIQGYGEKVFKPNNNITKAETMALIYRALGKEAEAQKEGQKIEEQRSEELKKKGAEKVWADGYLSLAQKDGLITQEEFQQATDPEAFLPDEGPGFDAGSFAQRQEVAVWIAKAFKIDPMYSQTLIFNNYKDWEKIDQEKIPYIEVLLKNKIMNGDNGCFYPKNSIKRSEMAQVLANMEDYIYKANNINKKYGFIEDVSYKYDNQLNKYITTKIVTIRVEDGSFLSITLNRETSSLINKGNEFGSYSVTSENEVIVNKDESLGKSDSLRNDDQVLVLYDKDNKVRYIEAKTYDKSKVIHYGTVGSVDKEQGIIEFTDMQGKTQRFPVSQQAIITINNEGKLLEEIPFGAKAYITVNHNVVTRIEVSNLRNDDIWDGVDNDVKGIVEDINYNLNYISLFGPNGKKDVKYIRTYNFSPKVKVKKDGQEVSVSQIEIGDTVYIKFDKSGSVELINVESNYISVYGEILNIGKNHIIIKKEDETLQEALFDNDITVVKNGKVISKDEISIGDKVRLTLNTNTLYTKIKGIHIQESGYVTGIYKGKVFEINKDYVVLSSMKTLNKNKWILYPQKGFVKINLDNSIKLYYNNNSISLEQSEQLYKNKYVYFAAFKDYGENQKIAVITYNNGFEKIYDDQVVDFFQSSKNISLSKSSDDVKTSIGSIVIRNGKLTYPNNINKNDPVYIVALREPTNGEIISSIVQIEDKPSISGLDIYRGKISSIDSGKSFTVESFSILKGTDWEFVNTPKTFDLSSDTRIVDVGGVVNNRDFIDYTNKSYKDKIVYIVSKGTQAQLISDNIYGINNIRGEVYDIITTNSNDNSKTTIKLKGVVVFNINTNKWDNSDEAVIDIVANSIIIKNKEIVSGTDIEIGDKVRIIKKDNLPSGNGLIILVEE